MNTEMTLEVFLAWARPLWDGLRHRKQNRALVMTKLQQQYPFGYSDPLDRWLIVIRQISMTLNHYTPFEDLLVRLAREAIIEYRGSCRTVQDWRKIGTLAPRLKTAWLDVDELATYPRLLDAEEDTTPIIHNMLVTSTPVY